jgi:hypothetical protein
VDSRVQWIVEERVEDSRKEQRIQLEMCLYACIYDSS